jgi:hypothetical protein
MNLDKLSFRIDQDTNAKASIKNIAENHWWMLNKQYHPFKMFNTCKVKVPLSGILN